MEMDEIDVILVFNKIDSIEDIDELDRAQETFTSAISISCKKDEGIDTLRHRIVSQYEKKMSPYNLELEHSQAGLISKIRKFALIIKEDYKEDRICLSLRLPPGGKAKINNLISSQEILANS
jgi:GTP-binding protein HflX